MTAGPSEGAAGSTPALLGRRLRSRLPALLGRGAALGLVLVLLSLAGFAGWAALTTQQVATQVRIAVVQHDAYQRALYAVSTEQRLHYQYAQRPDPRLHAAFQHAVGQLAAALQVVRHDVDPADQAHDRAALAQIETDEQGYVRAFTLYTTTLSAGQRHHADLIATHLLNPRAATLERRMATDVTHERSLAFGQLQALDRFQRGIGGSTALVFTLGMLLLALLALLIRRQHRRATAALEARQTALAAANADLEELNARLEGLATTDPLTGLPNHRALIAALDHELERSQRYGRPCALLVLDLDHFKALNDTYGHGAGDATLREFATVVGATLRGVDLLGRWGGEEFVALLPETDATGALEAAERLRAAVAAQRFTAGGGVHLTCSVGVAAYPQAGEDRAQVLAAADGALYAAKALGRNQARVATDPVVAALARDGRTPGSREEVALAGTVEALAALVAVRDQYTGQHTAAVESLAVDLARALGLEAAEARMVGLAGRLHDIGKVVVPDAVLQKPGRLSAEEWALVHQHPTVGADVVRRVPALRPVAPVIRAHHERWDGHGYPDGLAGSAIPIAARIVAVATAYAAMTSDRPYRPAVTADWAVAEVRRGAGTRFDPAVVAALEQVLGTDERALAARRAG